MSNMLTGGMGTLVSTVRRMVLVKNMALVICKVRYLSIARLQARILH